MGAKNNLMQNVIIIFLITAFWDVILRLLSEDKIKFFGIENMKWVNVLEEYFQKHTVLSAALIAGFVGAITHIIIIKSLDTFKMSGVNLYTILLVLLISGIVGIPMRYSGLFPHLNEYYYKPLGFGYSFATDAFSGFVVGCSYQIIKLLN